MIRHGGGIDGALKSLAEKVRGRVVPDAEVASLTTFRVGGTAAALVEAADERDLEAVSDVLRGVEVPVFVLGKGSNVLISDSGFHGVVLTLGAGFDWVSGEDEVVDAGGNTHLPRVANWAARRSLAGMEFTVAIPATVGGAVKMNAGAHGSSVSDVLEHARIFHLGEGSAREVATAQLGMGYRSTVLGEQEVVCAARFGLSRGESSSIRNRMKDYRRHRSDTQPVEAPNAGSMFRNPEDTSAGKLIEAAGLKGSRVGGAEVSTKHANFFLAHPGAGAQDVYDLMATVQETVEERTGVLLVPEVRMVGEFEGRRPLRWSR